MDDKQIRDIEKRIHLEHLKCEASGFTDESCIAMMRTILEQTADVAIAVFHVAKLGMSNKEALGAAFTANAEVIKVIRGAHESSTPPMASQTPEERSQLIEETAAQCGLDDSMKQKLREAEQEIDDSFNKLAADPDSIEAAMAYCACGESGLPAEDRDTDVAAAICKNLYDRGLRAFAAAMVANEVMSSGLSEVLSQGLNVAKKSRKNVR